MSHPPIRGIQPVMSTFDVVIAGGGPAGLSAALALGRARKRVLLCDAGPRRNATAVHVQNFVTRDGVPPDEFRRIAREQLTAYPNVEICSHRVESIAGERDAFAVRLSQGAATARRILLCTGLVDELPPVPGVRELWGTAIFQCPYCHGWEVRDQRFAYLAADAEAASFALLLRGWTADVMLLTNAQFVIPSEVASQLRAGGIVVDERRIDRLVPEGSRLDRVVFSDGGVLRRDALFVQPRQQQVELVRSLVLALDPQGLVKISDSYETSMTGVYAGGDLTTKRQTAILAAAAGMQAAAMLNQELTTALPTPSD